MQHANALSALRLVEVRVMNAHTIHRSKTLTDKSDTFVRATLERTGEHHHTPTCWNTSSPHWYHSLHYSNVAHGDTLRVDLYQHSDLNRPTLIASTRVAVSAALEYSARVASTSSVLDAAWQRELSIEYKLEDGGGSISLIIVDRNVLPSLSSTAPAAGYIQFEIHKLTSQLVHTPIARAAKTALTKVNDAVRRLHPALDLAHPVNHLTRARSTYAIKLRHVDHFFHGKQQQWNRGYEHARRIFDGTLAPTIRAALVVQHGHLYGKPGVPGPHFDTRRHHMQSTGALLDGLDFLELMHCGVRNGKSRMYTYVIINNELRFCETGSKILKDVDSKHAMHACASPSVVYAGEMHFCRHRSPADPEYTLVVDNNSGTYAPDPVDLPKLRLLLEANFPGLAVEALDFRDPLLVDYSSHITRTMSE